MQADESNRLLAEVTGGSRTNEPGCTRYATIKTLKLYTLKLYKIYFLNRVIISVRRLFINSQIGANSTAVLNKLFLVEMRRLFESGAYSSSGA